MFRFSELILVVAGGKDRPQTANNSGMHPIAIALKKGPLYNNQICNSWAVFASSSNIMDDQHPIGQVSSKNIKPSCDEQIINVCNNQHIRKRQRSQVKQIEVESSIALLVQGGRVPIKGSDACSDPNSSVRHC